MVTLITFSGCMGCGKSICARFLAHKLQQQGESVFYLRFEKLKWVELFQAPRVTSFQFDPGPPLKPNQLSNWGKHFHLTLNKPGGKCFALLVGNWLRTYFFLGIVRARFKNEIVICNRYFLDNLAQLPLERPWVEWMARLSLKTLPVPRLAFLLKSPEEAVLAERKVRYEYRQEYVRQLLEHYQRVENLAKQAGWPIRSVETGEVKKKLAFVQQEVQPILPIKTVEEFT